MGLVQFEQRSVIASCHDFAEHDIDLTPYQYIPAVKYAKTIETFCQRNELVKKAGLFCLAIVRNNNQFFYTSNDAFLSAAYMSTGLYRADNFFYQALCSGQDVMLADQLDDGDVMRQLVVDVLSIKFKLFNAYCLVRRCTDCNVIIALAMQEDIADKKQFYEETYVDLEDFSIEYIDQFMALYLENMPSLRHTRFACDKLFRDKVIHQHGSSVLKAKITDREAQCLYWLSLGKTADETAALMGISGHTVVEYKKKIMAKLDVSNIAHAVREAMQMDLI